MANILITAGGTSEPIDSVRSISNTGTGRLGSRIADLFASDPSVERIFYVCSHKAIRPASERVCRIEIGTVAQLQTAVTQLITEHRIDAVVHSMAVSDYRVKAVSTPERVAEFLRNNSAIPYKEEEIRKGILSSDLRTDTEKLSSKIPSPLILLEQTPKILPLFRQTLPEAVIVGFKLLNQVSQRELIDTAYGLLVKSRCDFVLANDASDITADRHKGYLIDSAQKIQVFQTKQEIAEGIVTAVRKKVQHNP